MEIVRMCAEFVGIYLITCGPIIALVCRMFTINPPDHDDQEKAA